VTYVREMIAARERFGMVRDARRAEARAGQQPF